MTGRFRAALLLLPVLSSSVLLAQTRRLRGADRDIPVAPAPVATPDSAPTPVPQHTPPAAPAVSPTPSPAPASAPAPSATPVPTGSATAAPEATSLLQQPAKEAQISFVKDQLSIKAENASLTAILHQFSAKSGMTIEGLGGDERVFGTFGPGAPRDVLADLLHGTSYNLVLLGSLDNGAPRQLILSPAAHTGAVVSSPTPQAVAEDNEPEQEPPPPPEPPQQQPTDANQQQNPNGVKTPQQLFEQLQRMRQGQQNQQQPVQQDAPPQPQ
jgi:hypothetical protein